MMMIVKRLTYAGGNGKGEWDTAGGGCVENRKWLEGNLSFVRVQSVYVQYKKDGLDSELSELFCKCKNTDINQHSKKSFFLHFF